MTSGLLDASVPRQSNSYCDLVGEKHGSGGVRRQTTKNSICTLPEDVAPPHSRCWMLSIVVELLPSLL